MDGPIRAYSNGPMEQSYRPPNILPLTGITMKDFVHPDDLFDQKIKKVAKDEKKPQEESPYDRLPAVISSLNPYPPETNLKCWSCCFQFGGRPIFIPIHFRENEKGSVEIDPEGVFCTFNCAWLHIDVHYHKQSDIIRLRANLCLLYLILTGKEVTHIEPAYPKTELQAYGGPWVEEMFWEKMRELDPEHGLADYTPGSIRPEREWDYSDSVSLWSLCGGGDPDSSQPNDDAGRIAVGDIYGAGPPGSGKVPPVKRGKIAAGGAAADDQPAAGEAAADDQPAVDDQPAADGAAEDDHPADEHPAEEEEELLDDYLDQLFDDPAEAPTMVSAPTDYSADSDFDIVDFLQTMEDL